MTWQTYESAAPGYPVTVAYMDGSQEVTIADVTEAGRPFAAMIAAAPELVAKLGSLIVVFQSIHPNPTHSAAFNSAVDLLRQVESGR